MFYSMHYVHGYSCWILLGFFKTKKPQSGKMWIATGETCGKQRTTIKNTNGVQQNITGSICHQSTINATDSQIL